MTERRGLRVTTIERTVVDLAATLDLTSAVTIVDRALYVERFGRLPVLTTKGRLRETWERMLPFRGSAHARVAIEFGAPLSGSPGESVSRVNIAPNGFPTPLLQQRFLVDGRERDVDFFWKDEDAIGEFDGKGKYVNPEWRAGMTAEEVVYAEKLREDGLRRQVRGFTRWDFAITLSQRTPARTPGRARFAAAASPAPALVAETVPVPSSITPCAGAAPVRGAPASRAPAHRPRAGVPGTPRTSCAAVTCRASDTLQVAPRGVRSATPTVRRRRDTPGLHGACNCGKLV